MKEFKNKKIAVTGGTGFLGAHLIRGLFEKGYRDIVSLKRPDSKTDLLEELADRIKWVEGDLLEIDSLKLLCRDAEIVIHCAAKVSYNPKHKQEVFDVNVSGTANMVNACLEAHPSRLIFVSSVAALGRPENKKEIDENTEWEESKFNTHYGFSKYMAELEVWRGMAEGLDVMVFNPSMVLGPSFWGDSSTKLFTHVFNGSKIYPLGSNGFIDVRDAVGIIIKMLDCPAFNEKIIGVGSHASYKTVFEKIADASGLKSPRFAAGKGVAKLVAILYSGLSLITGKDPTITTETVKISYGNFRYSNEKSVNLLDHKYVPLEKTILDTVRVYEEFKSEGKEFGVFRQIFS